jgi:hypothetical protein
LKPTRSVIPGNVPTDYDSVKNKNKVAIKSGVKTAEQGKAICQKHYDNADT